MYEQAPYQDCDKDHYSSFLSKMPEFIDWKNLANYEKEDNTVAMQTLACTSDHCEIVDINTT